MKEEISKANELALQIVELLKGETASTVKEVLKITEIILEHRTLIT